MWATSPVGQILASGDLTELIGQSETVAFDAKCEPYPLDTPTGRYELAKDVSAFANASGGLLVIGLKTEPAPDHDLDVVSALTPVASAALSASQYLGVIKEYVHPFPAGLTVDFLPHGQGAEGLWVITVPPQNADVGPFLIVRIIEDGVEVKHIVAGFAQRQGDHSTPLSPKALQARFRRGSDTVSVRLGRIEDRLEAALSKAAAPQAQAEPDLDTVHHRIADILESS